MSKRITLMNGPNLNLLGKRQPEVYGFQTLENIQDFCVDLGKTLNLDVTCFQSNAEHELINKIHEEREQSHGIIFNPGAFSHTSIALLDALNTFSGPILEVHISNIHKRESFRHHSYISYRAEGVIAGFGVDGYEFAVIKMSRLLAKQ